MADGLDGIFKDFGERKSFDNFEDFAGHLAGRGEIPIHGSIKCIKCSTVEEEYAGPANIDSTTGGANVLCGKCEDAIAAKVAARSGQ